ncbi:MAG: hypothetical protein AABM67_09195 [Acidobacteriota bacterium]
MKRILHSLSACLLVIVFAAPLTAQNPNVAIHLDTSKDCVKGTFRNLKTVTIGVSYVELWIFDAKTCKRLCIKRKVIHQKIKACDRLDFDICCDKLPEASGYIYYVRVSHSLGKNETWAFVP